MAKRPCFNYLGEMPVLQGMNFCRNALRGISRKDFAVRLKNDAAFIKLFIDKMNGYTRPLVSGRLHRLVNLVAIHAFATMFREQGGMDVKYPVGESLYHGWRKKPKKPGKHDMGHLSLGQPIDNIPIPEFFS